MEAGFSGRSMFASVRISFQSDCRYSLKSRPPLNSPAASDWLVKVPDPNSLDHRLNLCSNGCRCGSDLCF